MKVTFFVVLVLTAAAGCPSLAGAAQPGDGRMTKEHKTVEPMTKKPVPPPGEDLVITPAGPVPKENVHQIGPNQAVRRNPDGSYTIVPKTASQ